MYGEQKISDFSPHPFEDWFFIIVIGVPFVALLIWAIINPKESYLFGKRWMFKEEPHISKAGIFWLRLSSIIILIITVISFINWLRLISFF